MSRFFTMLSTDASRSSFTCDSQCCDICVFITMLLNRCVMINRNVVDRCVKLIRSLVIHNVATDVSLSQCCRQLCQDDSFTCIAGFEFCLPVAHAWKGSEPVGHQRHCSHRLICYRILLWWPFCVHLTGDAYRKVTLK